MYTCVLSRIRARVSSECLLEFNKHPSPLSHHLWIKLILFNQTCIHQVSQLQDMAAKTKLTLHKYTEKQIEMILQKVKSDKSKCWCLRGPEGP